MPLLSAVPTCCRKMQNRNAFCARDTARSFLPVSPGGKRRKISKKVPCLVFSRRGTFCCLANTCMVLLGKGDALMVNREYFALGSRPNKIRELFEYGKRRISVVGEENVFDYSIGNPSIPAPDCVNETAHFLLHHMDSKALHGYTSSVGDLEARHRLLPRI